ncbi:MAG: hypothetical protein GEU73_01170 [Chloroflexi bacterium]|nr:hypothetical protein [Chloroflexota bacterium]
MADIESISHSGMVAPDSRAVHTFYETVLSGVREETVSRSYEGTRGGNAHSCGILGDYVFVTFPRRRDVAPLEQLRGGEDSFRHGFAVSRTRFDEITQRLQEQGVPFEGPLVHPERGPLGESIYFRDPGGNYFEVCWRRDEDVQYNPVRVAEE